MQKNQAQVPHGMVFMAKFSFFLFDFLGAPLALTRFGSGYRLYASRWRARIPALSLALGPSGPLRIPPAKPFLRPAQQKQETGFLLNQTNPFYLNQCE
jgi:hypothetical protein